MSNQQRSGGDVPAEDGLLFDIRGDWEQASGLEWLEANGIGGYASSSLSGANTRRYHGLLVAATRPPVGRMVLLSKLDERILFDGAASDLATNIYRGAVHPSGFQLLETFRRDLFPIFEFGAGDFRMRKTIGAIQGENTVVVLYELLESPGPVTLELRPFVTARDYHSLTTANDFIHTAGRFEEGILNYQAYQGVPSLAISVPGSRFDAAPDWYYRFHYPIEEERGLDALEDLFTPGVFTVRLEPREILGVIISTGEVGGRDAPTLLAQEARRRETLVERSGVGGAAGRVLTLAADQFIVHRGAGGRSVIAGYHWFTDWGRDTMISLPGLCLATRRFDDARKILQAFAESARQGILPNRFPDDGEPPEYNTADATLWFFVAVRKYLGASGDTAFVRDTLLPVLRDIVAWHDRGTFHGIHVDSDGLLIAGSGSDQLTWMDAQVDGRPVTPRNGKPVEIQALWYNALSILAEFEHLWGPEPAAAVLRERAARVRERFHQIFWCEEGFLFDVVEGQSADPSFRPNQLFALTLPFPLVEGPRARDVLNLIEEHLFTPYGLRTLDPADPRFCARCTGPPQVRDAAYHQGTIWPWLLGPFITALVRLRGESGAAAGRVIVESLAGTALRSICPGSIPENFDGAAPFAPRGCIAQAWSVGEILRVMVEDLGMGRRREGARDEKQIQSPEIRIQNSE